MMGLNYYQYSGGMLALSLLVGIWTMFWMAVALWRVANKKQGLWFFFLLIFSMWGILPLIYIFLVEKMEAKEWFS